MSTPPIREYLSRSDVDAGARGGRSARVTFEQEDSNPKVEIYSSTDQLQVR